MLKKQRLSLFSQHSSKLILIIILVMSFFVRITYLDYPLLLHDGDGMEGYLLANHIIRYNEYPSVGPFNPGEYVIRSSPLYYYLIALFLLLHNSPVFLSFVSIVIQLFVIYFVYLFGKNAFDDKKALIATALYSINPFVISHALYIWPNYFMQFFLYLSYLLLLLGYKKNNYQFLFFSMISYVFAVTLHISALPMAPIFFFLIISSLHRMHTMLHKYLLFVTVSVSTVLLLNFQLLFPDAIHISKISFQQFPHYDFSLPILTTLTKLISFNNTFFSFSFLTKNIPAIFLFLLLVGSPFLYILHKKVHSFSGKIVWIMLFAIILQVVSSAFTPRMYPVYLLPILLFVPFLFLETLLIFCTNNKLLTFVSMLFLIILFSNNGEAFIQRKQPLKNQYVLSETLDTITAHLADIKNENDYADYSFFTIRSFYPHVINNQYIYGINDAVMLAPLENKLKEKLTVVKNKNNRYSQLGNGEYSVLVCYHQWNKNVSEEACRQKFFNEYPHIKTLYSVQSKEPISIFFTRLEK